MRNFRQAPLELVEIGLFPQALRQFEPFRIEVGSTRYVSHEIQLKERRAGARDFRTGMQMEPLGPPREASGARLDDRAQLSAAENASNSLVARKKLSTTYT